MFVKTKHGADKLADKLRQQGVAASVLHGGKTQSQRTRVLEGFKLGHSTALIATDVAARGIHVDDVSLVVHVDPPQDHKDYLHRAGRTARAGATGTVVSIEFFITVLQFSHFDKCLGVASRIKSTHKKTRLKGRGVLV